MNRIAIWCCAMGVLALAMGAPFTAATLATIAIVLVTIKDDR